MYKYPPYFLNCSFNEKVEVINLLCLLKAAYQKKGQSFCILDIIKKLKCDEILPPDFMNEFASLCESFYVFNTNYDKCGLSSVQEIAERIRKILNNYCPF